jgi:hypothetical protein
MVDLVTREKSKTIMPGEYGYVKAQQRIYARKASYLIVASLVLYFAGKSIFYEAEVMFNIAAMLILLPAAQFLSRYVSFIRYSSLKPEEYQQLVRIADRWQLFGELPIIRGKKDFLILALVITQTGIYGLIKPQKNKQSSEMQCKTVEVALSEMLKPRGLNNTIHIFNDF